MVQSLAHIALVVRDYDEAISWFTQKLDFTVLADEEQPEERKRWVLVAPPGAPPGGTSILLARASKPDQELSVGNQAGGRVFLFLQTDDFKRDFDRLTDRGVEFVRRPKLAPYGTVAVFKDLYGNRWDLVQFVRANSSASQGLECALMADSRPELLTYLSRLIDALTIRARYFYDDPESHERLVETNEAIHRVTGHLKDLLNTAEPFTVSRARRIAEQARLLVGLELLR